MLSNPPYGKTWKIDENAIVDDRSKKNKEHIKDPRFLVGLPSISDGQLLFLTNMISKMKTKTELGSRIASVHNGSSLFTGDAGQGESEIRKMILENDLLECIIALPKNIFYNTGIPTYIWILSNKKEEKRKGKVQLINAIDIYKPLRKNLGDKNCELTNTQIEDITKIYLDFEETETSKIFTNQDFGYRKIIVERPLRLKAQFSDDAIESLRFHKAISDVAKPIYEKYKEKVYQSFKEEKTEILNWLEKEEIKLTAQNKNKLFDVKVWKAQNELRQIASELKTIFGEEEFFDFNVFKVKVNKALKSLNIKISQSELKLILEAVSWKDEEAEPVIKKTEKDGTIIYEADSDLRDSENVPLDQDIDEYFEREVLQYVPDSWIDYSKTKIGYSISFTRYFYNYVPPRSLEEIAKDIEKLQSETEGLLEEFLND